MAYETLINFFDFTCFYTFFAKTGTAQTSALEKRKLGKEFQEHAWFVSYFYYKDTQPLTMVILIEHSGNTAPAVSAAKYILLKYKKLMVLS